jgi:TRAP-type C4-dicarboxylate transport system substrate-binding protein
LAFRKNSVSMPEGQSKKERWETLVVTRLNGRLSSVLAAALASAVASPLAAESWDMPMAYPDNNFHTETGKGFAECVGAGTESALEIVIHGNGSLFSGNDIKRAVQTGQAPIGERLLSAHQNENALFGVDSVPFLATGYDASIKLWEIARPTLETILEEQNLVLLYSVPWPPQGIYVKKPIASAADLKGVKWRAYSPATARIAELVGAQPVTVQAAELPQAMATGVVESYMSSGSTGLNSKTYEHIKYWYDTQAWLPKNAIIVNKKAFDALDKPTQQALTKAAAAAESRGWKSSEEKNGWYLDQLRQKGMTIAKPSEELTADLRKVGNLMLAEWLRKAGAEGRKVIDAYRAM